MYRIQISGGRYEPNEQLASTINCTGESAQTMRRRSAAESGCR